MANWSEMLKRSLKHYNDTIKCIVVKEVKLEEKDGDDVYTEHVAMVDINDPVFTEEFDSGYGGTEGCHFTAWGEKRVYFPICYDGAEWIGNAPLHPCMEALAHQGGG